MTLIINDTFTSSINTEVWRLGSMLYESGVDPLVTVVASSGLQITPRSSVAGLHVNGLVSLRPLALLKNMAVWARLNAHASDPAGEQLSFALCRDAGSYVEFFKDGGRLKGFVRTGGGPRSQLFDVAFSNLNAMYCRFRFRGATPGVNNDRLVWETQESGSTVWVVQYEDDLVYFPDLSQVHIEVSAGTYQSVVATTADIFNLCAAEDPASLDLKGRAVGAAVIKAAPVIVDNYRPQAFTSYAPRAAATIQVQGSRFKV